MTASRYLDSPYCFSISAALCLPFPAGVEPVPLSPLVVRWGLIEKPRLIVRAIELNPLVVDVVVEAVPRPSGEPVAPLPVPVPVPLALSL